MQVMQADVTAGRTSLHLLVFTGENKMPAGNIIILDNQPDLNVP